MKKRNDMHLLLKKALEEVKLPETDSKNMEIIFDKFSEEIKKNIKKYKIKAEIFVGGSFAKETIIKKEVYDADVFVRFDKKYKNGEISKITEKILSGIKHRKIHGSRDYFEIKASPNFLIEVIPVMKIKNPKEAQNITDLSYFHVNYIRNKIKKQKIRDEIILAKAFCYANKCYGAESYIKGFSGYAIELLIYHYGSFLSFIKAIEKSNDKIIIDTDKHFKNKNEILMNINSSKLQSPIIIIDPTYKQRNAIAALSNETFKKFKEVCRKFLRDPSIEFFKVKKIDIRKIQERAKSQGKDSVLFIIKTKKQKGDIAGTKLLKFFNYITNEAEKSFNIKDKRFEYIEKENFASCLLVGKKKDNLLFRGPFINDKKNLEKFRKKHKKIFFKSGRAYSNKKVISNLNKFIIDFKGSNKGLINEMSISGFRVLFN